MIIVSMIKSNMEQLTTQNDDSNNIKLLLNTFSSNNDVQIILPPMCINERVIVHEWCEQKNYHSHSVSVHNDPNKKIIIIEKKPRILVFKSGDTKKFIKDNKLPIPVPIQPYLDYFLDLYEKDYSARTLYNELVQTIESLKQQKMTIREYHNKLLKQVKEAISGTESYKKFLTDKIDPIALTIDDCNVLSDDGTTKDNIDRSEKYFISLDIKQANYSSMKYYYPDIFQNTDSWEEFVGKFTDCEYFVKSKQFRLVVFGGLNNKRNSILWKRFTKQMIETIQNVTGLEIFGKVSDDEIIIKTSKETIDTDLMLIKGIIDVYLSDKKKYWRISPYSVKCIASTNQFNKYYVKEDYTTKQTYLKGCDVDHFAQLYKKYHGLEYHEYDFKTTILNEVVTFDDPLKITLL